MWKSNTKWENLSGLHFDWNVEMLLLHSFNSSQQYRTLHEGAKEVLCQICHLPHLCLDYKKMFKGQNFYHTFIVKIIIILKIQRLSKALGFYTWHDIINIYHLARSGTLLSISVLWKWPGLQESRNSFPINSLVSRSLNKWTETVPRRLEHECLSAPRLDIQTSNCLSNHHYHHSSLEG